MQGTIVSISVEEGDAVAAGQPLLIMDAMKMQHEIRSPARGYVRRIAVEAGETIYEGHALLFVEEADVEVKGAAAEEKIDLDHIRPDLAEYFERRAHDARRQAARAVARRRKTNQRTARQNLDDLVDPGSFVEYGAFAIASQRTRRTQRGPDREDAGRRADHRHRPRQRLAVRAREEPRRRSRTTTTRCWPAPRARPTTTRRTGCSRSSRSSACRWCSSPRAAAAGRATSTCSRWPASTPWPSISSGG